MWWKKLKKTFLVALLEPKADLIYVGSSGVDVGGCGEYGGDRSRDLLHKADVLPLCSQGLMQTGKYK